MALNFRRQQLMEKLGIKQAPTVAVMGESSRRTEHGVEMPIRSEALMNKKCEECPTEHQEDLVEAGQQYHQSGPSTDRKYSLRERKDSAENGGLRNQTVIRSRPMPARKCPTCLAGGTTVWVIPGKQCPVCYSMID